MSGEDDVELSLLTADFLAEEVDIPVGRALAWLGRRNRIVGREGIKLVPFLYLAS